MNKPISILLTFCCCVASCFAATERAYECGTWVQISAVAVDGYQFAGWNDGEEEAVRQVEVLQDATYIAYFTPQCTDYATLPVLIDEGVLRLDVDSLSSLGLFTSQENVSWYQVVGSVDSLDNSFPYDDLLVGGGYTLRLQADNFPSGYYYAVALLSDLRGCFTDALLRTVVVQWVGTTWLPSTEQQQQARARKLFLDNNFYILMPDGTKYTILGKKQK